ncbi:unnamed protein product [Moneuplotes crassus]|uniref:C2 domain-containing protein n=1 Tax=Euplotes crassus TaxID=5936 RepID=A0AAD1XKJ7_EUPCR|nr:unnamed protein product [Moneuplotes crassus]
MAKLVIEPKTARLYRDTEMFGKMDPFIKFKCGSQKKKTKTHNSGGKNPRWNDVITMGCFGCKSLTITVYDEDTFSNDKVGTYTLPISEIQAQGIYKDWIKLMYKGKVAGELYLEITYMDKTPGGSSVGGAPAMYAPFPGSAGMYAPPPGGAGMYAPPPGSAGMYAPSPAPATAPTYHAPPGAPTYYPPPSAGSIAPPATAPTPPSFSTAPPAFPAAPGYSAGYPGGYSPAPSTAPASGHLPPSHVSGYASSPSAPIQTMPSSEAPAESNYSYSALPTTGPHSSAPIPAEPMTQAPPATGYPSITPTVYTAAPTPAPAPTFHSPHYPSQ